MEEAEEEGDPIRRPAVSTNLDSQDLSDTEPPTRQHTPADMKPPTHIQQRTAWSGLSERRSTQPLRDLRPQGVGRSGGVGVGWWGYPLRDEEWGCGSMRQGGMGCGTIRGWTRRGIKSGL